MSKDLQKIYQIQNVLKSTGYSDYQRISQEILEYFQSPGNKYPDLKNILDLLEQNIPWEYIKGSTEFLQYEFLVNENTLIPRLESEDFVKYAIELINDNSFKTVIDVGTGSGCLIIPGYANSVLSKESSRTQVYATDISEKALKVAKANSKNILDEGSRNIQFVKTNLIQDLKTTDLQEPILILANLPYIPTEQMKTLDSSVIDNEPILALDGGTDGLKYYKELFDQITKKEIQNTTLLIEIEPSTLKDCLSLIKTKFANNSSIEILKDFRNHERFVLISLN